MKEQIDKFRTRAREFSVADCAGNAALYEEIATALRRVAEVLNLRFKYLHIVPWSFIHADSPEGAKEFLRGATSKPLGEQDDLTRYLYEKYRADLEERAGGGDLSSALAWEVAVMEDTPLDESAGEGYHRGTHLTRVRAHGSKSPYIVQSTRLNQNYKLLRKFVRLGAPGQRVLRFEWRNWQRLLQARHRQLWRPKRMSRQDAFQRIYHMDVMAEERWSEVCQRKLAPGQSTNLPAPDEGLSLDERQSNSLRVEYLLAVLTKGRWYQVRVPSAGLDEDGQPTDNVETKIFQLLSIIQPKTRPELMPTIETDKELALTDKLALHVQEVSVSTRVVLDEGSIVVFDDADARWMSWQDLGPWNKVMRTLSHFLEATGVPEHNGCVRLAKRELAIPPFPFTDPRCPVLTILTELKRRGWQAAGRSIQHIHTIIGPFDGREAIRMKSYFVVLLEIERCLPLTSMIPSDQPILYYKLLLNGKNVEPGLGNNAYRALIKGEEVPLAPGAEDSDSSDPVSMLKSKTTNR